MNIFILRMSFIINNLLFIFFQSISMFQIPDIFIVFSRSDLSQDMPAYFPNKKKLGS